MLRYLIILNGVWICLPMSLLPIPGPKYQATQGEAWPRPQRETKQETVYYLDPANFNVTIVGENCSLMYDMIRRYGFVLRDQLPTTPRSVQHQTRLEELVVDLSEPCEDYPHLDMDESYNLKVAVSSKLRSHSIWGIIRGFETFSQLVYLSDDYSKLLIQATEIDDYPRYSHRGLLLDTSRHFITVQNIMLTLDAMSMNKMNVLHWHIVDDQSFPFQSKKFPELSDHGAYHPLMVYTKSDIALVVKHARERGIRVVPEFDVPGHTRSWGKAHPEILTKCYVDDVVMGLGPMNPIANATYELLRVLIQEVQNWFPDKYYHIGGDEVEMDCWASNPALQEYMVQHNMTEVEEFYYLFMSRVIPLLRNKSVPIVWQEVFEDFVPLPSGSLVHVWKPDGAEREDEINDILRSGHKVLYSADWYLDELNGGGDWERFYVIDPRTQVTNASLAPNVVGGEACMWGEVVDDRNLISRVWPRASAVAEALWSASFMDLLPENNEKVSEARNRLEEHTCRMIRRNIPAQPPNGPGFCVPSLVPS